MSDDHADAASRSGPVRHGGVFAAGAGPITTVAFSPDGRTLATASEGSAGSAAALRLWDLATGRQRAELSTYSGGATSFAFSPDGLTLAVADDMVRLWSVAAGESAGVLDRHSGPVWAVAFNPDGAALASTGDTTIVLWDVAAQQPRAELHHGGRRLISGNNLGRIRAIAFSPDGATLASASDDDTVRLWEVASGQQRATLRVPLAGRADLDSPFLGAVPALAFSPDGAIVASASEGGLHLWDVAAAQLRTRLLTVANKAVAFSPDGAVLAAAQAGRLTVWDLAAGHQPVELIEEHLTTMAFSPDSTVLAVGHSDGTVRLREDPVRASRRGSATAHLGPAEVSFLVTRVRDHAYRDGLLVSGQRLTGRLRQGMVLQDRAGRRTRVLALEFLSPRDVALGEVTIQVERTDPSPAQPHAVLIATTPS
jgi:WD40 repeat protein